MISKTPDQIKHTVDKFLDKLGARAKITDRYYRKPVYTTPVYPFQDLSNLHVANSFFETQAIPIIEVEMRLDQFESIVENIHDLELLQARYGTDIDQLASNALSLSWEQNRHRRLRETYPALQKAWDNYQLMLRMVENDK
jgi:hypothetical protein